MFRPQWLPIVFVCMLALTLFSVASAAPPVVNAGDKVKLTLIVKPTEPIFGTVLDTNFYTIRLMPLAGGEAKDYYHREIKSIHVMGTTPDPTGDEPSSLLRPARAALMKIDSIPTNQADFDSCWDQCAKGSPDAIGMWLNCGAIDWPTAAHLIDLFDRVPDTTTTFVVVEHASDAAPMVVFHAKHKVWMPDGTLLGFNQPPSDFHTRDIRTNRPPSLPLEALDVFIDGGTLRVKARSLTATEGDARATIDNTLAKMAGFEVCTEATQNGIRNALDNTRAWTVRVNRLSQIEATRVRDAERTMKQIVRAEELLGNVDQLLASFHDAAIDFDRFYNTKLKKIWRRSKKSFEDRQQQQQSVHLQKAVKEEINAIQKLTDSLQRALAQIPTSDPVYPQFLRCYTALSLHRDILREYWSALDRNQPTKYERIRDQVIRLAITGC